MQDFGKKTGHNQPKILVMDDDRLLLDLFGKLLARMGIDCTTVLSGEDAIAEYVRHLESDDCFDAVIIDLNAPDTDDGRKTIKQLLHIDMNCRIVVTSGFTDDPYMEHYKDFGLVGKLEKPFKREQLQTLITEIFNPAI